MFKNGRVTLYVNHLNTSMHLWYILLEDIINQAKNLKKLMTHSWEKCPTDGQTGRDNGNFIGKLNENNFFCLFSKCGT